MSLRTISTILFFAGYCSSQIANSSARAQTTVVSSSANPLTAARDLYRNGKFDAAVENYQSILQHEPDNAAAYSGLARCYLKQRKLSEAFKAANDGIAQPNSSTDAHAALGEVLFRMGEMGRAEKEFMSAVNSQPPSARGFLGLARLYAAISLHRKAKLLVDQAYSLDPDDPDIRRIWIGTLDLPTQEKMLEQYLSGPNDESSDTRHKLQRRLELLKVRQANPRRVCQLSGEMHPTVENLEPLMADSNHQYAGGLQVEINGKKSKLELDTGASGILVSQKIGEKAGIAPVAETEIRGIGDAGVSKGYVGYAETIKIGNLEFKDCLVEVSTKNLGLGTDGLIGADVFSDYLITIDFRNEKLGLDELPKRPNESSKHTALDTVALASQSSSSGPDDDRKSVSPVATVPQDRYIAPEMKSYLQVFRFGHDLLVPTIVDGKVQKLFLMDTGSYRNFMSLQTAEEMNNSHRDSFARVRGLSGEVKNVRTADDVTLQMGGLRQQHQRLMAFDFSVISNSTGTEVSGILGFDVLKFLTIRLDYRDGLVDFHYDRRPSDERDLLKGLR